MSVSYPTKLLLAFRSGDRCALPDCGTPLTVEGKGKNISRIGEAAHIAGEKPDAKRYNPEMSDKERNRYNNLIYLCSNCHHGIIDSENLWHEYPIDKLLKIKNEHECKVREAINEAFFSIGFPELEEVTEWIIRIHMDKYSEDFSVTPPKEKLIKNDLGNGPLLTITMGLSVANLVSKFIESFSQTDPDFPDRLKSGFLEEYYRLRKEGHRGDDLFDLMCRFSQRRFKEQTKRSAGIAVLCYLFETCDVFEK